MSWAVSLEMPEDETAISALTEAAYRDSPHGSGEEAAIVERLRADGDLALSLVVKNADRATIGHAAFSPVAISDGTRGWFGLGPVSVIPLRQRAGIGSALIAEGLERLRAMGAGGCVVLGDPHYYTRFGFESDTRLSYPGPPAEFFLALPLTGDRPQGRVSYAPAFSIAA